jgi:hypothetical protein
MRLPLIVTYPVEEPLLEIFTGLERPPGDVEMDRLGAVVIGRGTEVDGTLVSRVTEWVRPPFGAERAVVPRPIPPPR